MENLKLSNDLSNNDLSNNDLSKKTIKHFKFSGVYNKNNNN